MQITQTILDHFKFEEGYRLNVYKDSLGNYTIGIGHLLGTNHANVGLVWTDQQVMEQFQDDVDVADAEIRNIFHEYDRFSSGLQLGLLDMSFQLGNRLTGFHNTIQLIHAGKFADAANSALQSAWARETPHRAQRTTQLIRTGSYVN